MKGDLITGIIATIFSIFYLSQTYSIKIFGGADAIADARTIPKIWVNAFAGSNRASDSRIV